MAEATNILADNRRTDHQLRLERKRIAMGVTVRFHPEFRTLANPQSQ